MGEEELVGPGTLRKPGFDYGQLTGPAIGAGAAFLGSIPQMMEARRLKRERDRLLQEGPGGFTPVEQEQMAAARARAASSLAPGYAQEMEGIAQQQADTLAAAKRGSQTGSNMLNVLSRMNAQGQAARRNLAMRGAQAQRQAQSELGSMAMGADARRIQRQQLWERQMAALDAARRQYATEPFMAPLKGAMAFMPVEGFKSGTRFTQADVPDMMEPKMFKGSLVPQGAFPPPATVQIPTQMPVGQPGSLPQSDLDEIAKEEQRRKSIATPAAPTTTTTTQQAKAPVVETVGLPPVKDEVYTKEVIRKDSNGNPVVYGTDGIRTTIAPDGTVLKDRYFVEKDGKIYLENTKAKQSPSTNKNQQTQKPETATDPNKKYALTQPEVGNNNLFVKPYMQMQEGGGAYIFETDGTFIAEDAKGNQQRGTYIIDKKTGEVKATLE